LDLGEKNGEEVKIERVEGLVDQTAKGREWEAGEGLESKRRENIKKINKNQ